jgi:hypothetical protein
MATAAGHVNVPLAVMNGQLSIAAKLSTKLALNAHTPNAEQLAGYALGLVAREEAKAEVTLTADLSSVTGVAQSAIADAEVTAANARELALSTLAKLTAQANVSAQVEAHALATELTSLSRAGGSVLSGVGELVGKIGADATACSSSSPIAQLDATATLDAKADLGRITGVVSALGGVAGMSVSQLTAVAGNLAADINAHARIHAACDTTTGDAPGSSLIGTVLGAVSAPALEAVAGATVTGAVTLTGTIGATATYDVQVTDSNGNVENVIEDGNYAVLSVQADGGATLSGITGLLAALHL